MTRLLLSIQQDVFGGPHNQWQRIAPILREEGIELIVCLPGELPDATARLVEAGIEVVTLPTHRVSLREGGVGALLSLPRLWRSARSFQRLVRESKADVVVAAGLANLPAAIGAKLAGVPLVWQLLSVFAPLYVRASIGLLVAMLSQRIMVVGRRCREAHVALRLVPWKVIEFVPPVDLREFAPTDHPSGSRLVVGTVGNLNPHKGHDYLWNAAERLWSDGLDFDLLICGKSSPSYEHWYDEERTEWLEGLPAGWRQRVVYTQPTGSVSSEVGRMSIFCLPSRSEGIPTALLEAMASAKPCIAFDVGGVSEIMTDGLDGLVVRNPDAVELAARLRQLLQDPALRSKLGAAARHRAEVEFAVEICAARHCRAITEALGFA